MLSGSDLVLFFSDHGSACSCHETSPDQHSPWESHWLSVIDAFLCAIFTWTVLLDSREYVCVFYSFTAEGLCLFVLCFLSLTRNLNNTIFPIVFLNEVRVRSSSWAGWFSSRQVHLLLNCCLFFCCVFAVGVDWRRFGREDSEAAARCDSGLSFPAHPHGSGRHSADCLHHPCLSLLSEQGNITAETPLATT